MMERSFRGMRGEHLIGILSSHLDERQHVELARRQRAIRLYQ